MKKASSFSLISLFFFLSIAHISAAGWSSYVPSRCTATRALLQAAKALNDQMIYMAAMEGSPEAIRLLHEYYAKKNPMELMCEMGASSLSQFANGLIKKVVTMSPGVSSATESILNSIATKALQRIPDPGKK